MEKAIIYTRAKVDLLDNLFSMSAQIRACKEFAEKNDLQVCGICSDTVLFGTKCDYVVWDALVKNRKHDYDCIIVYDYSRIGRKTTKRINDIAKLKAKNIRVLSVAENVSDELYDTIICFSEYLHKGVLTNG